MTAKGGTKTNLACWDCRKPISGARTYIDGKWRCGDCTYLMEHPDYEAAKAMSRRRAKTAQRETLFPLPQPSLPTGLLTERKDTT